MNMDNLDVKTILFTLILGQFFEFIQFFFDSEQRFEVTMRILCNATIISVCVKKFVAVNALCKSRRLLR